MVFRGRTLTIFKFNYRGVVRGVVPFRGVAWKNLKKTLRVAWSVAWREKRSRRPSVWRGPWRGVKKGHEDPL